MTAKRKRGRPVVHPLPPHIDASPEEIVRAVLSVPRKLKWRYLERRD
ncbi:MAG: hypothetical protein OXG79_04680 [Chloroflexi bacterium]|nr:hypothetical protein [Chloroflexota bacterium]